MLKTGDLVELSPDGKEHFRGRRSPRQDDVGLVVKVYRDEIIRVRLLRLKGSQVFHARFWRRNG